MKSEKLQKLEGAFNALATDLGFKEPEGLRQERRALYDSNHHGSEERLSNVFAQLELEATCQRNRGNTWAHHGLSVLKAYTRARRRDFLEARMHLLDSANELNPSNEGMSRRLRELSAALGE